jgi:ATP-dependent DNA helicase RecG
MTMTFTSQSVTFASVIDISELVAELRAAGSDTPSVEVKSAAGGFPQSLMPSLCALVNRPGGGTVILGLDEATGFRAVRLSGIPALKQALASAARSLTPPFLADIRDAEVDGLPVIVCIVPECPVAQKPCFVTATGKAYGRSWDGDYVLSDLERTGFLVGRTHPRFDREPVPGSSVGDLDPELLAAWTGAVRERVPHGLGRYADDVELLRRGGVTTSDGTLTVAGLLALGSYPQQWFPRSVIQLASRPAPGSPIRAAEPTTLDGPIPTMLGGAIAWARRAFTPVITSADGVVRDDFEYPLDAWRELVSNSLVHRDLAEWSRGYAIEVRHYPDKLVIANPGGLFGISVDRLGQEGVTSPRNAQLLQICQYVTTGGDGSRVVEALASGIPTVTTSLAKAGMPPAEWLDEGIRFTVILRRGAAPSSRRPAITGPSARAVWDAIDGTVTVDGLAQATGLEPANLRRILRDLRDRKLVAVQGGPGRRTTYRRALE